MHLPILAGPRRRTRRALLAAGLPAILVAIALPAAAEANGVGLSQGQLTYSQTTSRPTSLVTKIVNGAVHVESGDGIHTISSPCRRVNDFEASCPGADVEKIEAFLGFDDDFFTSRTALPTRVFAIGGNDTYAGAAHPLRNRVEFIGGVGIDTASYALASSGVSVGKDETANDGRFAFDEDNIGEDIERIVGSPHGDILSGSNSTSVVERFIGGLGNDSLTGNGGPDVFEMGTVADGADRITGGPGIDRITYTQRIRPVNITLNFGGADDGEAGEGDEIIGANEVIIGGQADDTIRAPAGSTGAHSLFGGDGIDTLEGSDGPDQLTGGSRRDTLLARGGSDKVFAADGETDVIDCGEDRDGADSDTVSVDDIDLFTSCENRSVGVLRLAPQTVRADAGRVARMRLSWRHPDGWRKLRTIELRLLSADGVSVGEVTIRPRAERIADDGAMKLVRKASRLTRTGKTVTARLAVRLDESVAGQKLGVEVEATDTGGRRQLERDAGTVRVAR